ncbi:MAG: Cna B-type domain-containing protein, partial [Anaerovoracaceae bacterium]
VYTVEEEPVAGYTSKQDGNNFINTIKQDKTSVSGTKTWKVPDGTKVPDVTIDLLRDGEKIANKKLENGASSYSFTDLDKYNLDTGKAYVYTVEEEPVAGYTSKQDGYDFTNTIEQEQISVSGTKTWADDEDRDGIRPASIIVTLLADGEVTRTATVSKASDWSYNFTELPKYYLKDGHVISYTVQETAVSGYTLDESTPANSAPEGSSDFVYNLTNRYTPEKTKVTVTKSWKDGNDKDGLRPDSIQVQLYDVTKGSENAAAVGDPVTLNAENNWTYTWTDLNKKKSKGTEIKYAVREVNVPAGYDAEVTGTQDSGFTITNSEKTTSVSASKAWINADGTTDAPSGAQVTFELYKNGDTTGKTITLDGKADENGEKEPWEAAFDDLAKVDGNGNDITYTVKETSVTDGYKADSTEAVRDGGVITNRQISAGAVIKGTKRMAGSAKLEAGQYRFYLKDESGSIVDTAKNDADGNFSFSRIVFTEPGSKTYTISEQHAGEMIDGIRYDDAEYPVTVTASKDKDGQLKTAVSYPSGTPVFTNRAAKVLTVNKVWDDDNDKYGMRPSSVTVNLMCDGKVVDTAQLSKDSGWTWTFENLDPEKDYTVSEVLAEDSGYSCDVSYDGDTVTLTNEFIKTVDITASKTLTGAALKSGEFTFKLERKSGGDPIYAVNDSKGQIVFRNVPYDKEGYTVTEEKGSESGITYDKGEITYDADGKVTSEKKTFTNTKETENKSDQNTPAVLRVQKTSKEEPHDPLVGATYGLYRYVEGGNDILVEAETSDENGYMYYDKVEEGVVYYFKEISAPEGHEVDPYAGEKFMIRYDSNGQPYTCDADGNRTNIGDITKQDSTKAYVQVKKDTEDLGTISYNKSTQTVYENTAGNGIKAAAVAAKGSLPDGTVMKVTKKDLSSTAAANLEKKAGRVKSIVYYDVTFEKDGKEIEPETGGVKVIIQDSESLKGVDASDLKIVHLLDDKATAIEPLAGSVTADGGQLVQTTFTADSFSVIGVVEPEDSTTFGSNYMITSAGVSDQVSELNVSKLDSKGGFVKGAHLQIIEKSSWKVVADWTTGDGTQAFRRWFDEAQTEPMNVDTYYVLHEVSAPKGYIKADDIVFRINKYDSSITIYTFDKNGELVEDKDAEEKWVSDTTLTMVDIPSTILTRRRYKKRYVVKHHTVRIHGANKVTRIVKTGDESQLPLLITIMIVCAAALAVTLFVRKKRESDE